jgi:hypothetical protein
MRKLRKKHFFQFPAVFFTQTVTNRDTTVLFSRERQFPDLIGLFHHPVFIEFHRLKENADQCEKISFSVF